MQAIVAVDSHWGIGNKNELLVRIPNDQKMFRQETTGKVVILGRKTIETFPNGMPLKNRTNIILTRNPAYKAEGAIVVHNTEELQEAIKPFDTDLIYVIGGESIYKLLLPLCDTVHVTKIDHTYEADAFFPDLDADPEWEVAEESDEQTYFDLTYTFVKYVRRS